MNSIETLYFNDIETLYFNDIEELCNVISDKYNIMTREYNKYGEISIVAKYEEARMIIAGLVCNGYDIAGIDISPEEYKEYFNEYLISLIDRKIYCEKFKRENRYFRESSNITYVSNECNSACISHISSDMIFAFEIGEEDIEDTYSDNACKCSPDCEWYDECSSNEKVSKDTSLDTNTSESTYISRDDNGVPNGFSKTWHDSIGDVNYYSSYSHYSSDEEELREIAEKFGVKL